MKTVLISGHFNILHPGHLRLFRFAKKRGDKLIVLVEGDKIAGPSSYIPEKLRLEGVLSNSYVDEAIIINNSLIENIKNIKPNFVLKGKEFENKFNIEKEAIEQCGGKLIFSSGESYFSSIDLIKKEFNEISDSSISLPSNFMSRNNISKKKIKNTLNLFSKLKIAVIGDIIIDEYIDCEPLGMSQEDSSVVVTPLNSSKFLGGAAIVAAHAAGLGANVKFFSVKGNDDSGKFCLDQLIKSNVNSYILNDESRPTTLKQRFRNNNHSIFRLSHLQQRGISKEIENKLLDIILNNLSDIDLIVFSDFNYGLLTQQLVNKISTIAKEKKIYTSADSQSSSQIGDIAKFNNIDLLTPTEREARISVKNNEDGLVFLAEKIKDNTKSKNILIKLGREGVLVHSHNTEGEVLTEQVPALNSNPKDLTGAGDSMLITSSMALACETDINEAALLGSIAAAIQISRVGNKPLLVNEILREID